MSKTKVKIKSLEELRIEFDTYKTVYNRMVGNLYPSMVYADMVALQQKYVKAGGDIRLVKLPKEPTHAGYVG